MNATRTETTICRSGRELASRVTGGTEVTLYWCEHDDTTSLEIRQAESDETLVFAVARERALEAFYHPFAHLELAFDERNPVNP